MTVLLDPDSGRLRLTPDAWEALLAWAAGADPSPDVTALREAGVIVGGRPAALVAPALDAVQDPVCRLRLERHELGHRPVAVDGWATAGVSALLLEVPDGLRELVTLATTALPAGLARIVLLGPRPRTSAGPLTVDDEQLTALRSEQHGRRHRAAEQISSRRDRHPLVQQLLSGPWAWWTVRCWWQPAPGQVGERELSVLDSPAGLWWLDAHASETTCWPSTPSDVWRRLTVLTPDDEELA